MEENCVTLGLDADRKQQVIISSVDAFARTSEGTEFIKHVVTQYDVGQLS